jgi:RNA polymerase sigma-70 factor (ECF subfamily)
MRVKPTDEAELAALLRAAIGGDEVSYAGFLRAAAVIVRAVASRRLHPGATVSAEDIVQETLLAVHTKRHTWRQSEPVLPWLLTIARYKLIDSYRRAGARVFVDIDAMAETLAAPDTPNPESAARNVERALGSLSDGQQRVVRAIAVDGHSISETAARLGMKETAVRVAFHRGLAAIAAKFGRTT